MCGLRHHIQCIYSCTARGGQCHAGRGEAPVQMFRCSMQSSARRLTCARRRAVTRGRSGARRDGDASPLLGRREGQVQQGGGLRSTDGSVGTETKSAMTGPSGTCRFWNVRNEGKHVLSDPEVGARVRRWENWGVHKGWQCRGRVMPVWHNPILVAPSLERGRAAEQARRIGIMGYG